MFKRVLTVAGMAASVFTATVAGLAPQAHAQPFPPGVSCSDTTCRNDTNDTYLVEAWQHCRVIGTAWKTETPFNVVVRPHETVHVEGVDCPPLVTNSKMTPSPNVMPTEPAGITYFKAVIYNPNAPKVPSGSTL